MAEKINLRSSKVKEQKRRVADYGTETPLSSTAVERGSTRWLSGSTVVIEGLLDVTGLTTISGTLNVSGTTTLSGATTIAGPTGITGALTIAGATSITGQLDVTGPTTLAGTLDITGNTKLTGNMDVLGGGKITVGNTILSPGASNGGVEFASGGGIGGNAGGVVMRGSANAGLMALADTTSAMFAGASQITASGTDVTVSSALINLNAPQTSVNGNLVTTGQLRVGGSIIIFSALPETAYPPNLHVTSGGTLYRTTWTP